MLMEYVEVDTQPSYMEREPLSAPELRLLSEMLWFTSNFAAEQSVAYAFLKEGVARTLLLVVKDHA